MMLTISNDNIVAVKVHLIRQIAQVDSHDKNKESGRQCGNE